MNDGPFSGVNRFDNGANLKDIRLNILNPLATQVRFSLEPVVREIEPIAKAAYKDVVLDAGNKRLRFTTESTREKTIDLAPIIPPEFPGLSVTSGSTTANGIKRLNIKNGILVGAGDLATVDYDWDTMVKSHQDRVTVSTTASGDVSLKKLKFDGNVGKVSVSGNEVTLTVPNDPTEITAQIGTGTQAKTIKQIKLVGNTTGSEIDKDGVLSIQVPDDGTGGGTLIGNFKGFYETEGDLISDDNKPINGKSYAFVKDAKLKGQYYTPYMYVGNTWTEAPIDPAITYEGVGSEPVQGVTSIKPDAKIKLDSKGQLDLSGLYGEGHFIGFFDTKADLTAACPTPIMDRSFGYVKTATGSYTLMGYKRANGVGTLEWRAMAPYGVISAFSKNSSGDYVVNESIHGIVKNNMIETAGDGKITIKDVTAIPKTITVTAREKSSSGLEKTTDVSRLHFVDGIYVDTTTEEGTARIHHPQKVIHYNSQYETEHSSANYLGHLFYDDNSNTWMGWSEGNEGTSANPKWTRVIHRGMSDEVKGISSRLPIVTESVVPGNYGDNQQWEHCGWSYVESAFDVGLEPESAYKDKGLYIQTYARKGDSDLPSARPSKRLQVGFIDDESGEIFTRIQDDSASSTDPFYKKWSKVSMSQQDINNHNSDPNAHKDNNKYYKAFTANMTYKAIKDAGYNIFDNRCLLFADSHGLSNMVDQYSKIPYSGKFKISGRLNFDGTKVSGKTFQGQWILRIIRRQGTAESIVARFAYNHQSSTKDTPVLLFHAKDLEFNAGDTVKFYLQCLNDSQMGTNFPDIKFIPMRTYFVIEDNSTDTGSLIAETQRTLLGPLYARDDVSIHAHRSNNDGTGSLRLYAGQFQTEKVEMTKAT